VTDQHAGDALSALLDGELPAAEAAAVRTHVESCAACAHELGEIRAARRSLRTLPAVEPPPGFLESLQPGSTVVPLRRRRRAVAANVAAAAAAAVAAVVLLGSSPTTAAAVVAEPQGAADRHDATVSAVTAAAGSAGGAGGGLVLPSRRVTPTTAPAHGLDDVPRPFVAPRELVGYRLVSAYRIRGGLHLLYEKGAHRLSVFEERGGLGPLPADTTKVGDVWRWDDPRAGGRVVVVEREGFVATIVGDESAAVVLAAARAMPGGDGDAGDPFGLRLRRAVGEVVESLSPAS
jgi:hypothetical protein